MTILTTAAAGRAVAVAARTGYAVGIERLGRSFLPIGLFLGLLIGSPVSASAQARLWSGDYPAGTQLVCPEMGVAFVVPNGLTASFQWGNNAVSFSSPDGAIGGTLWMYSDCDPNEGEERAVPQGWTDREGKPVQSKRPKKRNGFIEVVAQSNLRAVLGSWKSGPGRTGVNAYISGHRSDESRLRAVQEELLASIEHFPPTRVARGVHGLNWIGWLGGKKLVRLETYSSGGSGYSNEWRIDLCADGTFTQSSGFAASFGEVGSAAGFDPSRGTWGVDVRGPNAGTLVLSAMGGGEARYDVTYDPATERTYLGGDRYFCVPNEWCGFSSAAPAFSGEVARSAATSAPASSGEGARSAQVPAPSGGAPVGLDGTWVAANEGYAYVFEGERYVFLVHDGISEWEFTDAGVVERSASILRLRSDDDPSWAEEHRFSLKGDVLVLDLDGSVEFRREP